MEKGELHIPKENKLKMIGLYYQQEEDQDIKLYIRHSKTGKEA